MNEIWVKTCFSDKYLISNTGKVKRESTGNIYNNRINHIAGNERLNIKELDIDITISREVLSAFICKPHETEIIHHINGDKKDSTLENLEWIQRGQNNTGKAYNSSRVKYSIPSGSIKEILWGKEKILVSSDGFVRTSGKEWKKPTIPDLTKNGAVIIWLPFDKYGNRKDYGKGCNHYIHRIIAEAFCEKREDQNEVEHIDKVKTNNVSSNLRWITRIENANNRDNRNNQNKKEIYKYTLSGEYTGEYFEDGISAAKSMGVEKNKKGEYPSGAISACCSGKKDSWKGFKWSFHDPENYTKHREEIKESVKAARIIEAVNAKARRAAKGPPKTLGKRVYAYKADTKLFYGKYDNGKLASKDTKVDKANISSCCSKRIKSSGGFIFSRLDKASYYKENGIEEPSEAP